MLPAWAAAPNGSLAVRGALAASLSRVGQSVPGRRLSADAPCAAADGLLGEIKKFNARATKYNYDIQWEPGPAEKQGIKLTAYFADVDATPVAGNWRYLRKTPRRAARARARLHQSDTESDDDDQSRRRARARA